MHIQRILFDICRFDKNHSDKFHKYLCCFQTYQCHKHGMLFWHRRTILPMHIQRILFDVCRFDKNHLHENDSKGLNKTHTLSEIGTQVKSPPWNQCSAKRQHSTNPLWSGNQRTSPPWNRCPILAEDTTVVATVAKNEKLHKINCKGWDKTRTRCTNTASHATHVLGCNQFKKFKQWKILQSMLLFSSTFFLSPLPSFQPRSTMFNMSNYVQHVQHLPHIHLLLPFLPTLSFTCRTCDRPMGTLKRNPFHKGHNQTLCLHCLFWLIHLTLFTRRYQKCMLDTKPLFRARGKLQSNVGSINRVYQLWNCLKLLPTEIHCIISRNATLCFYVGNKHVQRCAAVCYEWGLVTGQWGH